ncbi:type I methionyl aminopeptidase [Candidatus Curtissbacteria bacterium RIFCSPHIGHO2_12_41_11]|uniref:Methionine aminopeptidase n=5 Tax=Microgenomates group TaxID=1794810 RepID=A0A0H4TTV6_9BACT|nr:map, methionine aminopeptidase, methionyl aminopeptidase [uncultured Microgenomates bacterium Rifle_16ft_4_minimus_4732]KKQ89710.1 MAG: Methionine aminopeptidase [Candidatus Curtissbacteria bacterium GW2011_GWC2_38_9]KKS04715.1 MAG: Methionine aminopeptidase [Candidatus Curtissbacteria bacterium GW2011_GWA2_41_24]OGD89803.1 MAG: type I methionyl aminopeptidase [Candidatus Curtissbacteria bacterium RIFCSPHIGHO2_02_39_8]OGD98712.1 MAG: type I methionyl aminopeptidase [Candidatus Curtissbacteri
MNLTKDHPKFVKSDQEIELMKISGKICAQVLKKVLENVKVGVTCFTLDKIAKQEIEKRGASSSFMTVDDYKWTICTTVNQQVVHGIPNKQSLKNGDILGIDIGALYHGFHSDMAITIPIGKVSTVVDKFLAEGKKTLEKAISCAKIGNRIGDISATIQQGVESAGYSIVKSLTGHGIGHELHEEPMVPGFGKVGTGPKIRQNMVLAIEVIYTQGLGEVKLEKDNWTISSVDGSLAGLFEQTVLINGNGPIVLTPYL